MVVRHFSLDFRPAHVRSASGALVAALGEVHSRLCLGKEYPGAGLVMNVLCWWSLSS